MWNNIFPMKEKRPAEGDATERAQQHDGASGGSRDFFSAEQEVNNLFHRMMEKLMAAEKLTPPQYVLMERLRDLNRPCKMSEAAGMIFTSPAVMTGIVDRLADLALVQRNLHESDRRVILLTLTDKGRHVLSRVDDTWRNMARRFTARISRADLEAVVRVRLQYAQFLYEELKSLKAK